MCIYLEEILKRLCDAIEVDYEQIDFSERDWNKEFCWNYEQQVRFENWMREYVYENDKVRKTLTRCRKNREDVNKAVNVFVALWGWILYEG